ncbi:MAG: hypothetical protein K2W95_00830 [Candidatus Obscuribacterales bacterium]|nr:hypothetical protein [Candidatus Obscuribacterales bacterium]
MADGSGFQVHKNRAAGAGATEVVKGTASTQYRVGDMVAVTAGIATKVSATSKATHIVEAMITPSNVARPATEMLTTTAGEKFILTPVAGGLVITKSDLKVNSAPPIANASCNSNSTATSVLVTVASTDDDYDNGTMYSHDLDEQRLITDSQETGGVTTFTVEPAFSRALTTGDTVSAVPFCKGATAVKFSSTNPQQGIGTAVADKTGGHNKIEDVDLKRLVVYTSHPDQE